MAEIVTGALAQPVERYSFTRVENQIRFEKWSPAHPQRNFLVASITKPVVGMLAVQIAAEGGFGLNQPVRDFLPEFHRGPLRGITLRHLLTHTSGLPDMVPDNTKLRQAHASVQEFVTATAAVNPDFPPGTESRYSSMGFAVLAIVLEHICRMPMSQLLAERVFTPLHMQQSWLGVPAHAVSQILPNVVPCELPVWQSDAADWNWNSHYWRTLGAPWGGLISGAADLSELAQMILREGVAESGTTVFFPNVVRQCVRNQTQHQSRLPESDRLMHPWGYGWRMNWLDHSQCFSDFLPPAAFGHWGATGTLIWINPDTHQFCIILTSTPWEISLPVLQRISNILVSAFRGQKESVPKNE